jgi:hypothetical protein
MTLGWICTVCCLLVVVRPWGILQICSIVLLPFPGRVVQTRIECRLLPFCRLAIGAILSTRRTCVATTTRLGVS